MARNQDLILYTIYLQPVRSGTSKLYFRLYKGNNISDKN